MIQLINSLPFDLISSEESLKKDWTRFQDGLVVLSEIPDAIRGIFECEAEVIQQQSESEEAGSSNASEGETDGYDNNYGFEKHLPSGNGKLILTASKLYWIDSEAHGWSVDYKNVLLHAISKPDDHQSPPHIYLQLSCNKIVDQIGNEIDFDLPAEMEDEEKFVEIKFFVGSEGEADEMFVALSECASLHPCEEESESEFEGEVDESESEESEEQESEADESEESEDNKKCKVDLERFEDAAEN